jgi:uncharacterized membrane protein
MNRKIIEHTHRNDDTISGRRLNARREGVAMLIVLFTLAVLIVSTAVSISLGQAYLAKGQLQASADGGALAAIGVFKEDKGQLAGRAKAIEIAVGSTAVELGVALAGGSGGDVSFGDYDLATRRFRKNGNTFFPAARVTARRTVGSPSGPLN